MEFSYSRADGFTKVLGMGASDLASVESILKEIDRSVSHGQCLRVLLEGLGGDFDPSSTEMVDVVDRWAGLAGDRPIRIAWLVEKDIHFGIGRMAMALADDTRLQIRVFRERDAARRWVMQPVADD